MRDTSSESSIPWGPSTLSDEEVRKLRKIIRDDDHATWLRKKIRIFLPWMLGVVGGLYAGWSWLVETVRHIPKT